MNYKELNYGNSSDIAEGSEGILKVPVFSGSWRNAKYEGDEYYRVRIYSSGRYDERNHHTFRVEVLEVEEARNSKHIDRQINEINIDLKLV